MRNTREMNIDQLDRVNGGYSSEVANDSIFLHKLGIMEEYFDSDEVLDAWGNCSGRVGEVWEKTGITCISNPSRKNVYYYQGQIINRAEAKRIAYDNVIKGNVTFF